MKACVRTLGPRALIDYACVRTLGPRAHISASVRRLGPQALSVLLLDRALGACERLCVLGRVAVQAVVVAGVVFSPALARACAVCSAGRDEENALAFLLSTIGMSLMPLIAIGTLVFVIWRRYKKLEEETASTAAAKALAAEARRV